MIINPNTPLANKSVTTDKIADGSVTWPKLAPDARPSNLNLLDNWYFVGGGSQQGGGQFPVNQQGKTEYATSGYTIDRWKLYRPGAIVVGDSGVTITPNNTGLATYMIQKLQDAAQYQGKQMTLSFLLAENSLSGQIGVMDASLSSQGRVYFSAGDRLVTITFIAAATLDSACIAVNANAEQSSITVQAAKLELGDHQTLAYQDEDGNWVLNDPPPNFAEELAKCQRYQIELILPYDNQYCSVGVGVARSTTEAFLNIALPVTMRSKPTISYNGSLHLMSTESAAISPSVTSIKVDHITSNNVSLVINSSGLTKGQAYILFFTQPGTDKNSLLFDSNL